MSGLSLVCVEFAVSGNRGEALDCSLLSASFEYFDRAQHVARDVQYGVGVEVVQLAVNVLFTPPFNSFKSFANLEWIIGLLWMVKSEMLGAAS